MRFFSIEKIKKGTQKSVQRFPFVLFVAVTASVTAVIFLELSFAQKKDLSYILNTTFVAFLGISFMFGLALIAEKAKLDLTKSLGLKILGLLVLLAYYLFLPQEFPESPDKYTAGFILFILASHLFVSFAAFYSKFDTNAFWQFNKTILIHFIISAFYSLVLFAGLSIAIAAVSVLFELSIDEVIYPQLFFLVAGIFNTVHFLSGVPENLDDLDEVHDYPKELKIFAKYLLIPLVTVYIVILYAYTLKIIFEWEWPNGWVANLVLSFSIVGILSILLLHPIKDDSDNKWIKSFTKYFYYSLIPLVILLMLSIYRRISDYGVTVNRFLVATLAVWLAFIVIYYVFSREKNIKVIPFSLFVAVIFSAVGPMSAFRVSERNQMDRLIELLNKNEIYVDGKISNVSGDIGFEDEKNISSIVDYMVNVHGEESLQPLFSDPIDSVIVDQDYGSYTTKILKTMGLEFISESLNMQVANSSSIYTILSSERNSNSVNVENYEWMIRFNQYGSSASEVEFKINKEEFGIDIVDRNRLVITKAGEEFYKTDLSSIAKSFFGDESRDVFEVRKEAEEFVFMDSSEDLDIKIIFSQIQIEIQDDEFFINQIEAVVLFNFRD